MGYSYKSYSDTKEVFKKFVNAAEGQAVYGISRSHIMEMAKKAGAVYKVGNTALINTEIFEAYMEQFKENPVPLPKYIVDKKKLNKYTSFWCDIEKIHQTSPYPNISFWFMICVSEANGQKLNINCRSAVMRYSRE